MVEAADIGWGSYSSYEGPLFWGKQKYQLPRSPTEGDRILNTITTTEGGAYDAYNGYDKCICTSGLIQWCDRAPFFLVCKMLGAVASKDTALLSPVIEHISARGYTFGQTAEGSWRFWRDNQEVVDTADRQRALYLGGATGLKGDWDVPLARQVAREWAAACSSVWEEPEAQKAQREYTLPLLMGFATTSAKDLLNLAEQGGGVIGQVFRSAYISFAANNPKKASDALKVAVSTYGLGWDLDWLIGVLKTLTFQPGIAIYPHRYNKIRPVLEHMYGVDLPNFSEELQAWKVTNGFKGYLTTVELQLALLKLGYDLGPAGADGAHGEKTRAALRAFEVSAGVPTTFQDGYPDKYTIPFLEKVLEQKGFTLTWEHA